MEIMKEEFPKLLSVLLDFKEAVKSEGKIKLLPLTDSYRSKKLKMSGVNRILLESNAGIL